MLIIKILQFTNVNFLMKSNKLSKHDLGIYS